MMRKNYTDINDNKVYHKSRAVTTSSAAVIVIVVSEVISEQCTHMIKAVHLLATRATVASGYLRLVEAYDLPSGVHVIPPPSTSTMTLILRVQGLHQEPVSHHHCDQKQVGKQEKQQGRDITVLQPNEEAIKSLDETRMSYQYTR
jgi:hypothetical protein